MLYKGRYKRIVTFNFIVANLLSLHNLKPLNDWADTDQEYEMVFNNYCNTVSLHRDKHLQMSDTPRNSGMTYMKIESCQQC